MVFVADEKRSKKTFSTSLSSFASQEFPLLVSGILFFLTHWGLCRNYERESQELAFDFSLSLNHRRFIFHPELTMLQSFINWNDIYKSSAMEKVKVDLDKMVWMFKKKKKLFRIRG